MGDCEIDLTVCAFAREPHFDSAKSRDCAVYMAALQGGEIGYGACGQALYAAERKSLKERGAPIVDAPLVATTWGMMAAHIFTHMGDAAIGEWLDTDLTPERDADGRPIHFPALTREEADMLEAGHRAYGKSALTYAVVMKPKFREWSLPKGRHPWKNTEMTLAELLPILGHSAKATAQIIARIQATRDAARAKAP